MSSNANGSLRRLVRVILTKAYTKSLPILAGWRERIAAARLGSTDPDRVEAERLSREYVKHLGKPLDDAGVALLTDAMAWLLRRYGGVVPQPGS